MRVRLSLPEKDGLTIGVEEEFVLADPVTGGVALVAPPVLETATGIHTDLTAEPGGPGRSGPPSAQRTAARP